MWVFAARDCSLRKQVGEQGALRMKLQRNFVRWGLPKRALRDVLMQPANI